jgi:nucleotide-binding universal stress UspA family protein
VSGVRRVIAGVSGSPGSVPALRYAAELARENRAALIPVLVWTPPGGEMADRTHPSGHLRRIWADAAWQRLWAEVELALGGVPADVEFNPRALRGEPADVLVDITGAEGDVLVVGTGRRGPLRRLLACHVSRYCLAHARCPVVAVPPPSLAQLGHGLRGWARRHRGLNLARTNLQVGPG